MVLKLLYPLVRYASFFNIFQYVTFRAAYAAITALLIAFLFGPWVIRHLRGLKAGHQVREDVPESHRAKTGTPSMGGALIVLSITASVLIWQDPSTIYTWMLLAAVLGYGAIGFVDDLLKLYRRKGLAAWVKFGGQIAVSGAIVALLYVHRNEHTTLLYLPFLKRAVIDLGWFYAPFAVLLLTWYSNSVNITDGLDGLAIGLVILVGLSVSVLAYLTGRADWAAYLGIPFIKGSWEITIFCLAMVGASVGFLWFNAHPAEVMMGDTGSLALGGALGVVSLIIKKEVLLLVLGGVFVLEGLSVMIQVASFQLTGRRVFRMAPLHHHFELKGWDESKVIVRFWIISIMLALASLATLKLR
jgi:phospho-N-acetylmuramoyl-pentapeptide-transferase